MELLSNKCTENKKSINLKTRRLPQQPNEKK